MRKRSGHGVTDFDSIGRPSAGAVSLLGHSGWHNRRTACTLSPPCPPVPPHIRSVTHLSCRALSPVSFLQLYRIPHPNELSILRFDRRHRPALVQESFSPSRTHPARTPARGTLNVRHGQISFSSSRARASQKRPCGTLQFHGGCLYLMV